MNNKGFAITSIIYGLMLLFIVIVTSFLSILVGRNRRMDKLVEGVYDSLEYKQITVKTTAFENNKNAYVTREKGLYYFEYNDCLVYLPKSVILVKDTFKNAVIESENPVLYYFYNYNNIENGGENLDDYKELTTSCMNK